MPGDPPLREAAPAFFRRLQDDICRAIEAADGAAAFREDLWKHEEEGGGRTRVLAGGGVFEKAGVNFSAVGTTVGDRMAKQLNLASPRLFAAGISLVLHPASPHVPAVHMNLRYIEPPPGPGQHAWFGGGADLTPSYLVDDDARHFHRTFREICDSHDRGWYPKFKKACDDYFYLPHRGECRGVGGIFFDYEKEDPHRFFTFVREAGEGFLKAYLPIVERRKNERWTPGEKAWQLLRRGRYVEFNLVYDRGTLFGLETKGRVESILMSLPPEVRWEYDHRPEAGSREERLLEVLRAPRGWA